MSFKLGYNLPMSPALLALLLIVTTLLTSFISGLLGMAGGIILMGVLVHLLPVGAAMVMHGIIQLVSNAWRTWLWRAHLQHRIFMQSVLGSVVALAVFTLVQFLPDKKLVLLFLGLLPFMQYAMPARLRLDVTKPGQGVVCGFIVTAIQLVAGVSGAMLDQFYVYTKLDRREQVATKAACQSVGHITKLIYFGGILSSAQQMEGLPLWLYPCVMLAAMAGNSLAAKPLEKLSNEQFRRWTRYILLVLGAFYLFQAIQLYLAG